MIRVTDDHSNIFWDADTDNLEEACADAVMEFSALFPSAANFFITAVDTDGAETRLEARIEIQKVINFYPNEAE